MKKFILITLLFISIQSIADTTDIGLQYSTLNINKKKTSDIDKKRILFGPGIGFGAAARTFSINLSPSVAYCFTDKFHLGSTLGFNYFQQAYDYNNVLTGVKETYKYKIPAYSFSVYARYLVTNFLILTVEPEVTNTKFISNSFDYDWNTGKVKENSSRLFIPSFLVGGGYAQRFGTYGYTYLMVVYDLVQNPNARYYQTLDYKLGVMINLWQ